MENIAAKIKPASEIGDSARKRISDVFVDGFSQWLQFFSKNSEKLSRAFAHIFVLDVFFVAVIDGVIVGIAACTDGNSSSVRLNSRELRRHLGLIKGTIAGFVLRKELENHPYPFPIESGTGSIEFVATGKTYRGKGIASAIIKHILSNTSFNSYVLEVLDTNVTAIRLYQRLGFREFLRISQKHGKISGVNYLVYMKYEKDND